MFQAPPPSMFAGQLPPQLLQMLIQQMQQQQTMGQNPNPLASVISNPGGAMGPQGQGDQNGSAGGGNGMGGLMQIINAMKSQQAVNGVDPQGGPDIMRLMAMMKGQ